MSARTSAWLGVALAAPLLCACGRAPVGAAAAPSSTAEPSAARDVAALEQPRTPERRALATPAGDAPVALRAVDAETGEALVEAVVRYHAAGRARRERVDASGRWSGAPDTTRPVVLAAPGRVTRDARELLGAGEREVPLFPARERRVEIAVVDAAGRALAGAWVRLEDGTALATGADGRALARRGGGVPSIALAGTAGAPGFLERRFHALDEGRGALRVWNEGLGEEARRVVLERPARVEGRLLSPRGEPLAGAELELRPWSGGRLPALGEPPAACAAPAAAVLARGRTDPLGRFVLEGLPAGRRLLCVVRAEGRALSTLVSTEAGTARAGDDSLVWDLAWIGDAERMLPRPE